MTVKPCNWRRITRTTIPTSCTLDATKRIRRKDPGGRDEVELYGHIISVSWRPLLTSPHDLDGWQMFFRRAKQTKKYAEILIVGPHPTPSEGYRTRYLWDGHTLTQRFTYPPADKIPRDPVTQIPLPPEEVPQTPHIKDVWPALHKWLVHNVLPIPSDIKPNKWLHWGYEQKSFEEYGGTRVRSFPEYDLYQLPWYRYAAQDINTEGPPPAERADGLLDIWRNYGVYVENPPPGIGNLYRLGWNGHRFARNKALYQLYFYHPDIYRHVQELLKTDPEFTNRHEFHEFFI